ncbi:MAG: SRPBCC family protein [Saprospiraceae bacterium]
MNIIITILIVIAGIITLLLILALFTKKGYSIQREIIINAPLQKVFTYIRYLKNWDNFNERAVADPSKKNEFIGTDGTPGFIYAWSGNRKVGEGEKEIISITEGKKIETEIRFEKPFTAVGHTSMVTESLAANQTKVTFSNTSNLKYPLNILIPMVENGIAKDIDISLVSLKNIMEK